MIVNCTDRKLQKCKSNPDGDDCGTGVPEKALVSRSVSGDKISPYGRRKVPIQIWDDEDEGHDCAVERDIAGVAHPVLSVGKASDRGFGLWIPPFGQKPYLVRGGKADFGEAIKIPLYRENNVYYMPAKMKKQDGIVNDDDVANNERDSEGRMVAKLACRGVGWRGGSSLQRPRCRRELSGGFSRMPIR